MQIRLAAYPQPDSIVDGEGIRTVIWTQGCPHACLGCHNQETHDIKGGFLVDLKEIYEIIDNLEGQTGITFSGGDPFIQPLACSEIASYALKKGYDIWCYTGFTFEHLLDLSKTNKEYLEFLETIDVLIDGKFDITEKTLNAVFVGSSNQRIIDVKKSLIKNKAVLIEKYYIPKKVTNNRDRQQGIYI